MFLIHKKEINGIYIIFIGNDFTIITEIQVSALENEFRRKEKSSNTTSSRGENSKRYCH